MSENFSFRVKPNTGFSSCVDRVKKKMQFGIFLFSPHQLVGKWPVQTSPGWSGSGDPLGEPISGSFQRGIWRACPLLLHRRRVLEPLEDVKRQLLLFFLQIWGIFYVNTCINPQIYCSIKLLISQDCFPLSYITPHHHRFIESTPQPCRKYWSILKLFTLTVNLSFKSMTDVVTNLIYGCRMWLEIYQKTDHKYIEWSSHRTKINKD